MCEAYCCGVRHSRQSRNLSKILQTVHFFLLLLACVEVCNASVLDDWSRCGLHHYHTTVAFGSAFDAQTHCQLCGGENGPLCPDGQWERVPCTPTTNRECAICSECAGDDNVVVSRCNATHDVNCALNSTLANSGTDEDDAGAESNNQASSSTSLSVAGVALVIVALFGFFIFWRTRKSGLRYSEEQEFWWSLEDDVEFDCADKAALLEKARQNKMEALLRHQEATAVATEVLHDLVDKVVSDAVAMQRLRHEANATKIKSDINEKRLHSAEKLNQVHSQLKASKSGLLSERVRSKNELDELRHKLKLLYNQLASSEEGIHSDVHRMASENLRAQQEHAAAVARAQALEEQRQRDAARASELEREAERAKLQLEAELSRKRKEEAEAALRAEEEAKEQERLRREKIAEEERQRRAEEARLRQHEAEQRRQVAEKQAELDALRRAKQAREQAEREERERLEEEARLAKEAEEAAARQRWKLQRKVVLEREGDVGRLNVAQLGVFGGGKIKEAGRPEPRIIRKWAEDVVLRVDGTVDPSAGNTPQNGGINQVAIKTDAPAHGIRAELEQAAVGYKQLAQDQATGAGSN
eukprot:m.299820 g.299820  ORF g.299820 m.299820 type:complete len:586 (-) comp20122_c0_seq2:149-1906(-)